MNDYKISIIVPVYNAGFHLKKCLDSLVNQTLNGIQILAVSDCPTDGSDRIVAEYARDNGNISLLSNTHNLHVGNSRNRALEVAKGKYIGFFDHDDFGEPYMFERLYEIAEKEQADLVVSPFVAIDEKGNELSYFDYPNENVSVADIFKTSIGLTQRDNKAYSKLSAPKTIWNKLYRNDIIQNNHIRFIDTKISAPEDTPFNIEYLYYCKRVAFCHQRLYYHVYHGSNTGETVEYKSLIKYMSAFFYIHNFLEGKGAFKDEELRERFNNTVRYNIIITSLNEWKNKGFVFFIKNVLKIKKDYVFVRDAFKNTYKIKLLNGTSFKMNAASKMLSLIFK